MSEAALKLVFWGVRGTTPTPEATRCRFGGNTICASVSLGPDEHVILDCGSGLRSFGNALAARKPRPPQRFHVFLSHYHFDHVEGLPYFQPLYDAESTFTFRGFDARGMSVRDVLVGLIRPPYFPVTLAGVPARTAYVPVDGSDVTLGSLVVSSIPLHHPDGCLAYRLTHAGRTLVFATDHEHGDPAIDSALAEFARDAEYLIYDATYLPPEYESLRRGWGHSTWYAAVAIGRAARVKNLVLFHHHPDHTDDDLERVEEVARAEFSSTVIAREGMELPF